jgi:hypothetical protein
VGIEAAVRGHALGRPAVGFNGDWPARWHIALVRINRSVAYWRAAHIEELKRRALYALA